MDSWMEQFFIFDKMKESSGLLNVLLVFSTTLDSAS